MRGQRGCRECRGKGYVQEYNKDPEQKEFYKCDCVLTQCDVCREHFEERDLEEFKDELLCSGCLEFERERSIYE